MTRKHFKSTDAVNPLMLPEMRSSELALLVRRSPCNDKRLRWILRTFSFYWAKYKVQHPMVHCSWFRSSETNGQVSFLRDSPGRNVPASDRDGKRSAAATVFKLNALHLLLNQKKKVIMENISLLVTHNKALLKHISAGMAWRFFSGKCAVECISVRDSLNMNIWHAVDCDYGRIWIHKWKISASNPQLV